MPTPIRLVLLTSLLYKLSMKVLTLIKALVATLKASSALSASGAKYGTTSAMTQ